MFQKNVRKSKSVRVFSFNQSVSNGFRIVELSSDHSIIIRYFAFVNHIRSQSRFNLHHHHHKYQFLSALLIIIVFVFVFFQLFRRRHHHLLRYGFGGFTAAAQLTQTRATWISNPPGREMFLLSNPLGHHNQRHRHRVRSDRYLFNQPHSCAQFALLTTHPLTNAVGQPVPNARFRGFNILTPQQQQQYRKSISHEF